KQLLLAWKLYADDANGNFVPNQDDPGAGWVYGNMDYAGGNPAGADTDTKLLTVTARMAPYTKSPGIYKCPADKSTEFGLGKGRPRVRSVAMSQAIGPNTNGNISTPPRGGWL